MSQRLYYSKDGTIVWAVREPWTNRILLPQGTLDILDSDPTWTSGTDGTGNGYERGIWLIINFPVPMIIDKVAITFVMSATVTAEVSSTAWDGLTDPDEWTSVLASTAIVGGITPVELEITPVAASWLRVKISTGMSLSSVLRRFFLFGEYNTPLFEYWDENETAEINDDYALSFPEAQNNIDFNESLAFKIKNTDAVDHTYSLELTATRYGGDPPITNYFTLSNDGGSSKLPSITTANVIAGEFSETINVYADVPAANNPADGWHYFSIKVNDN
jgi:hypothetical protein